MPTILPAKEFEALVRAHHAEVYRAARRIAANDADALDVAQQVFLRVLEGKADLAGARDPGRVLRWLAARTALAQLRGAAIRREKEEQHTMERDEASVEELATRGEARGVLRRKLARLPDELRTALVLRFQEGWTFAQIAGEQEISEPSAHERVRRGLERLRGELSRAGFAGMAAVLPAELALDAPELAPAVPSGLERRLLELRAPAAISATAKLGASFAALLAVIAVASAAAWLPQQPRPANEQPALAGVESLEPSEQPSLQAGESRSVAPSAQAPGEARESAFDARNAASAGETLRGTLTGRCLDADGLPAVSVSVFATSLEHQGKFARFFESALSGADGRFTLAVPVAIEAGQEYVITTRHPDFVPHRREGVRVLAAATADLGDLRLLRSSHDVPGESILEVSVLDGLGAPLAHATVSALRSVLGADGRMQDELEHSASSDASGRALLELHRLGNKKIRVWPPAGEWGPAEISLGLDSPGRHAHSVTLQRGLTISGTIVGIGGIVHDGRGGFLAAWNDPTKPWVNADIDLRSGDFVLRGLEEGSYTLVHHSPGWSNVELAGVRAGTSGLLIQAKREHDLRDIGDHMAELHGEVRDAHSGAVLEIGAFDLDAVPLGDAPASDWESDILPTLIFPPPVQTAMFGEYIPPSAFHLHGLKPGNYAITARLEGYGATLVGPFELREREMRTGLLIEVQAQAALRGVLQDPAGRPLADGFVRVTGFGPRSSERDRTADAELRATRGQGAVKVWDDVRSDASGGFLFARLPAGVRVRLCLHHPDFEMAYSPPLSLRAGETLDAGRLSIGARLER